MNKFIQVIKSLRLSQILTVFLAGCLLVISTACSQGNIAQAGGKAYTDTAKRAMSDTYDKYDANQPFMGGMNGYNDDRRYDTSTTSKAVENIQQRGNTLKENVKNAPEQARQIFDEATNTAQNVVEDAARATKNTTQNIKESIQDLT